MQPDTYLVTGASSDIGCELVRQLAETALAEAAPGVILIAHTHAGQERLRALAKEIPALAERLRIVTADLTVESGVQRLIEAVREHGFPTHLVHLAAARLELTRVTEVDWPHLLADLEIQVRSLSMLFNAFLPSMAKSGRRCKVVVMLSSVTLGSAPKFMAEYVIAKHALLGLFRCAVAEFNDKRICINAVSPSMIDTRFLSDLPPKYVELAAAAHPAGRLANVADVVPLIRFLLAPQSDYIAGANIPITAGIPS